MQQQIGKEGIKVTFVQALPGLELKVAQHLVQACEAVGIREYAFFEALGGSDIILIYPSNYFGFQLTKYGIIPGILKLSTFLCFPYRGTNLSNEPIEAIKFLKQSTFAGFSLLKMNTEGKTSFQNIEEQFFSFLNRRHPTDYLTLGTLGWNEIILILNQESLTQLIENLINLSYEASLDPGSSYPLIKTFSYVAMNYDKLLGRGWSAKISNIETSKEFVDFLKNSLNKQMLSERIGNDKKPTLSITTPPGQPHQSIKDYWRNNKFQCLDTLGEQDILVTPTEEYSESWGDFLSDVLTFRWKFRNLIHSTSTILSYEPADHAQLSKKPSLKCAPFHQFSREILPKSDYKYEDLECFFGEKAAPVLMSQLFAFNNMSQNPTIGHVFQDMRYYPQLIMNRGSQRYQSSNNPDETLGFKFSEALSNGLELRSYGTYGHVERPYGRISKLKGGVHRALLALEYIPNSIIDRACPHPWFGFINAYEDPKFATIQEVIYVPLEALWTPENWWALFHEAAHIIIDRNPRLVSENDPVIKAFLTSLDSRENYGAWLRFFNELAAEIIGFELGYFGDLEFFLKTLWPYLKENASTYGDHTALEVYLFRTFSVEIWHNCYGVKSPKVSIEKYLDNDFLYRNLLNHIKKVERLIGKIETKNFTIASFMLYFKDFYQFIADFYDKIQHLEKKQQVQIFHQNSWTEDHDVKNITNHLLEGNVYWGDIKYPEAVLYNVLKKKGKLRSEGKRFPFAMATIITFWNAQMNRIKHMPSVHLRAS
jgi:hypothetical protein